MTDDLGPRLRSLRSAQGLTLQQLGDRTGISPSTLSRLESGERRATLELLLPLADVFEVTLDELARAPRPVDPRVHRAPVVRHGRVLQPLTRKASTLQAVKMSIRRSDTTPTPQTHTGFEWLFVLSGRLRLVLGETDTVLEAGEAAEFDTRLPHWIGSTGDSDVEALAIFGPQGERMHVAVATEALPRTD
ncbi:helix-turn-helix domain-containing protein [Frigoribacterium sp. 2-23]|uniref:helix-turn-helix domain-containing protein n=1 Tax=Frigoribacterium sp. 2-23 TaxID=3415006 RepID=UPI003C6F9102